MDAAVVFYVVWLCWSNGTATFRRPCFCLETICHLANLGSGSSLQITSGYTGNKWKWSMSQLKTWIELSNWKPNRSTKNSKQRGVRTVSWILQVFYIGQKLELQELDHKTWQFHTISSTYPLVPMNARGKKWMSSTCRCRWGNFHGEDGAWLCKRDCKTSKTPAYYFFTVYVEALGRKVYEQRLVINQYMLIILWVWFASWVEACLYSQLCSYTYSGLCLCDETCPGSPSTCYAIQRSSAMDTSWHLLSAALEGRKWSAGCGIALIHI